MKHYTSQDANVERTVRFQKFLRRARFERDMNMADVVRASRVGDDPESGINPPLISKIEKGMISDPRFSTIIKIARGYGVSLDDLAEFFK